VAQGEGPEFQLQYRKNKQKRMVLLWTWKGMRNNQDQLLHWCMKKWGPISLFSQIPDLSSESLNHVAIMTMTTYLLSTFQVWHTWPPSALIMLATVLVSFPSLSQNTWDNQPIKRKGLFGLMVLVIPVHNWLASLLWGCMEASHHARSMWQGKTAHFMTR
jgi:hypothetical protein